MSELQPIETAPKDGRWFMAYRPPCNIGQWDTFMAVRWIDTCAVRDFIWPDGSHPIDPFMASADDDEWIDEGDFYEAKGTLTLWVPLPELPK